MNIIKLALLACLNKKFYAAPHPEAARIIKKQREEVELQEVKPEFRFSF